MSEELLVKHCSPTLAGLKTGNLFSCEFESEEELRETVRRWNQTLGNKGLRCIPMKMSRDRVLIYVYRISKLSYDLEDDMASKLLEKCGYEVDKPERCVVHLKKRLMNSAKFPHEIGLFLGYPPEDVYGFIKNKAANCKCVGCWKVYGDVKNAKSTFDKYRKCTDIYCEQWTSGKSLDKLVVAG
ncbi:MAG: DUF3793 family protein [Eubacterium sp.]|nr:DUF3793 family protein [Eubacterium sp.]